MNNLTTLYISHLHIQVLDQLYCCEANSCLLECPLVICYFVGSVQVF